MKYKLGSLTINNWNDWDRVPRGPGVATWVASAIFGGGVVTAGQLAFAAFLVNVGVSAVTSWALSALAPKPDFSSFGSSGTLVNSRDAVAPADFVYGEVRKGGVITFYESTGEENKFLHQIIVIAAHEVDDIGDIYINDQVVTWDASTGFITDEAWSATTTERVITGYVSGGEGEGEPIYGTQEVTSHKIRIRKHFGNQTSPDADLLEESEMTGDDELTSAFVGNGIAYLYVRYEYDQTVFANGLPLVTVMVRGKKVYDPRTASTAYSNNAALCMRDFLTSAYGLGDDAIDDVTFSAAANECDESVTLDAGGTEKRYTINGIVKASTPLKTVFGNMSTACAGTLFWGSGYWKLKVGAYTPPVKTLTLDDLRGPINLQTRISMRDNFNTIRGTFNDADQDYITADYPELTSAAFKAEDNGEEVALDLPLPFTTSAATAQRLAKLTLFRGREQMTLSADFGLEAFSIEVGDIIAFDNPRYGFDEKEFEVIGWSFAANQQAGDLRVTLTLRETSEAAFDWNADESAIIGNNTTLPAAAAGLTINNLTASGGGRTQGDGTFINSAILDWDSVTNAFLNFYEIEWKALSDSVYNSTTTKQSDIELSPLVDGVEYIFRVRAVTVSGIAGPYATVQFTGGGDETAPALPTSITAEGGFEYITIRWTNPADADLNFVEVWENTTNSTSGATKVGISGGSEFVRSNLGLNETLWYFLKSVDYSGNASAFTAGVSATTTYLDDEDFANGIYSLFTEQGLYAIEDVTTLPLAGDFEGQKVFNRTDGKLYQWTGSAWELVVADVENGSITETKIANDAITTPKLAAGAVTANEISGNTITGDKIVANTITGGLLATSGIITNSAQINNAVIERAKIQDAAISTAKIGDNMVTFPQFSTGVTSASYAIPSSETQIAGITVSQSGAPAWIFAEALIVHTNGTVTSAAEYGQFNLNLKANGSLISGVTGAFVGGVNSPSFIQDSTWTSSGTTTYSLHLTPTGGSADFIKVLNASIFFVELKR